MFNIFRRRVSSSASRTPQREKAAQRTRTRSRRLGSSLERLELRQLMAGDLMGPLLPSAEYFVAPDGDDWNDGSVGDPFKTLRRALDAVQPGDTISLRNGVYEGGINIDVDNLTIRSAPGEWAVIESPLTQFTDGHANSVIRYGFDVEGGRLENLEVTGGYWYGVMFWDWWDSDFSAGSTHVGASGITLDGVKVHDTGVDAIKLTPGANDITIINSEVYNAGRRITSSADGIDNNNGDRMVVRDTYVHDVPGAGILTSGGTEDSLIERNLVTNVGGAGILAGFYSELEWLEPGNSNYYAAINPVVRNNIVVNPGQAGVGIYGALNAQVYNNTFVNPADDAQAPIQFGGYDMWISNSEPSYAHVASHDPVVLNNIVVTNPENLTRMVDVREASVTGQLTLDYNLYFGTSTRGILFIDRNLTGEGTPEQTFSQWQTNYGYDRHSIVADPRLASDWHLTSDSPAIGVAIALAELTDDFDGNSRLVDPPDPGAEAHAPDLGADQFHAGPNRATPPAPFGAPALEIEQKGYHDLEANTINVKVVRHGSVADTVTVRYATLGGSAVAGDDFTAVAGTLTFAPGETEKFVSVELLGDSEAEGDEHFLFTLSDPMTDGSYPVRLGHQHSASMTIDDQQTPITLHYATKWVSGDGSDVTGDGSEAHPWKSLQHAADHVIPGDYVIVMPGKYWGMNLTTDGKPDARITFQALPGVEIDEAFPGQQDGINLEGADFVTIDGFTVHDMPRAGLRSVNNDGVILRNNTSDHNTMWGILTGWSENIVVENNRVSRSQVEHGIYISNSADGAVVRNNVVWGNHDSGIQFNADRYLPGDGVHSRNLVEGNVIYDNGRGGGAALNFDGFQDGVVRNNLLYGNHATGIVLYVGFAADSSTNNLVTNNTVVMAEDARWALLMSDGSSGNTIVNNILLNLNPNRGSMHVEHDSLPVLSDHNLVQDLFQMDGLNGSFGQWRVFSGGLDEHSLVVPQANVAAELERLFVDAAGGDFHLSAHSPAIDVGDPFHAPAVDIFQHPRPNGSGVDLGAYEYGLLLPAVNVQFDWDDFLAYEEIGMAEIAVTRTGDTEGALAVEVSITDGTAQGDDFRATRGFLVFQPGQQRRTFRVFVNDDATIESIETVRLDLRVVGDPTGLFPTDQVGDPTGLVPIDPMADPPGEFPASQAADQATLHIVSDDAWKPGTFQFDSKVVSFNETDGTATVTVNRVGGSSGEVSLNFATDLFTPPRQATWIKRHTDLLYPTDRDTSATPDADFAPTAGTLTFADGETSKTITIPLVNDDWFEGDEALVLRLGNPTHGGTLGARSELKMRIVSDDAKLPGIFVFASPSYAVVEGVPFVNVTIDRLGGGNVEASVRLYDTGAGNGSTTASAWVPSDYGALPEVLTFAPGELSKTISIPIVDDNSTEIDEVFSIQLYSPSNDATVGDPSRTFVTIQDDVVTSPGKLQFASSTFAGNENGGTISITVNRVDGSDGTVTVQYGTSDGAAGIGYNQYAWAGSQYGSANGTLTFAPGETSKTIGITVHDNSSVSLNKMFTVALKNVAGGAQLGLTTSAVVTIVENDSAIEFAQTNYAVNESAGTMQVRIRRIGSTIGAASVDLKINSGSATAGQDFVKPASPTVTFSDGEYEKLVDIAIIDDMLAESDETLYLSLANATGASLGAYLWGNGKILAND